MATSIVPTMLAAAQRQELSSKNQQDLMEWRRRVPHLLSRASAPRSTMRWPSRPNNIRHAPPFLPYVRSNGKVPGRPHLPSPVRCVAQSAPARRPASMRRRRHVQYAERTELCAGLVDGIEHGEAVDASRACRASVWMSPRSGRDETPSIRTIRSSGDGPCGRRRGRPRGIVKHRARSAGSESAVRQFDVEDPADSSGGSANSPRRSRRIGHAEKASDDGRDPLRSARNIDEVEA